MLPIVKTWVINGILQSAIREGCQQEQENFTLVKTTTNVKEFYSPSWSRRGSMHIAFKSILSVGLFWQVGLLESNQIEPTTGDQGFFVIFLFFGVMQQVCNEVLLGETSTRRGTWCRWRCQRHRRHGRPCRVRWRAWENNNCQPTARAWRDQK